MSWPCEPAVPACWSWPLSWESPPPPRPYRRGRRSPRQPGGLGPRAQGDAPSTTSSTTTRTPPWPRPLCGCIPERCLPRLRAWLRLLLRSARPPVAGAPWAVLVGRGEAGGAGEPVLRDRRAAPRAGPAGARTGDAPLPTAGGGSAGAVRRGLRRGGRAHGPGPPPGPAERYMQLTPLAPGAHAHQRLDHRSHDCAEVLPALAARSAGLSIAVRTLSDAARPTADGPRPAQNHPIG